MRKKDKFPDQMGNLEALILSKMLIPPILVEKGNKENEIWG